MEFDNHEEVTRKDVLDVLNAYILAPILSELLSDLFENTSVYSTSSSSTSSDDETTQIFTAIHTIEKTRYQRKRGKMRRIGSSFLCRKTWGRDAGLTLLSYDGHEFFVT